MLEPWAPIGGYDVSATGGVNPFPTPMGSPMGGMGGGMDGLLKALQGVKAPPMPSEPSVSMISAPAPRQPTPVRGDQFMQLVQMLGLGGAAAAPQTPTLQPRLSQALGFR